MYKRAKYYPRKFALRSRPQPYVYGFNRPSRGRFTGPATVYPRGSKEELQVYDVTGTSEAHTTGVLTLLHVPIRTASNYNNRYGDKTTIKSIRVRGTITGGTASSNPQWVRLVVFWDRQPNNAVPGGNLPFLALTVNSNTEPQYHYRFSILFDKKFIVSQVSTGLQASIDSQFDFFKKCSLVSQFNGNSEVIGDINSGALYFYIIGDTADGTNNNPVVTWSSRTRYVS